jgi:hypothetical protein
MQFRFILGVLCVFAGVIFFSDSVLQNSTENFKYLWLDLRDAF